MVREGYHFRCRLVSFSDAWWRYVIYSLEVVAEVWKHCFNAAVRYGPCAWDGRYLAGVRLNVVFWR